MYDNEHGRISNRVSAEEVQCKVPDIVIDKMFEKPVSKITSKATVHIVLITKPTIDRSPPVNHWYLGKM